MLSRERPELENREYRTREKEVIKLRREAERVEKNSKQSQGHPC